MIGPMIGSTSASSAHSTFDPAPRSGRRMMSTSASSQMMSNGMAINVGRSMGSLRRCAERTSARLARASSERGDASSVTGCDVVPVAEVPVVNDTRERALSLTRVPVRLADLALAFRREPRRHGRGPRGRAGLLPADAG
jgi:hypothetical protein